tara:strand:- start:419 stop:655 length:237 start_codon:yes stop_codon:yes gene_type:complete
MIDGLGSILIARETIQLAKFFSELQHNLFSSSTLSSHLSPATPFLNGLLEGVPNVTTPTSATPSKAPKQYDIGQRLLA